MHPANISCALIPGHTRRGGLLSPWPWPARGHAKPPTRLSARSRFGAHQRGCLVLGGVHGVGDRGGLQLEVDHLHAPALRDGRQRLDHLRADPHAGLALLGRRLLLRGYRHAVSEPSQDQATIRAHTIASPLPNALSGSLASWSARRPRRSVSVSWSLPDVPAREICSRCRDANTRASSA